MKLIYVDIFWWRDFMASTWGPHVDVLQKAGVANTITDAFQKIRPQQQLNHRLVNRDSGQM